MKKQPYRGWCEGPLGLYLPSTTAKAVEAILASNRVAREVGYRHADQAKALAELDNVERSDVSVLTTPRIDHEREVVLPGGVDLSLFRKNPVVTFAHRYDMLPIGRALWIKQVGSAIKAKTRYSPRPLNWSGDWLPDAIWHLVQRGELRGKSIGFLPLEGRPPSDDEIREHPEWSEAQWIFTRVLLLEYAVAPIPTNPDALVESIGTDAVWGVDNSIAETTLGGAESISVTALERDALQRLHAIVESVDIEHFVSRALELRRGRV